MTCAECQERLAAFALGALEPAERAEVEAHLAEAQHEGCLEALETALQTVDTLSTALPPVAPRAEVWKQIAAQVTPRPRRVVVPWVVAAAAVLALAWSVWRGREGQAQEAVLRAEVVSCEQAAREADSLLTSTRQGFEKCQAELARSRDAVALLGSPEARVVAFAAQGEEKARATAFIDVKAGKAMVVAHGAVPPAGRDYELWVIHAGVKKPAGILRGGSVVHQVDPALLSDGVDVLAVTLEQEGGVPVPAGPIVLVAALTP